MKTKDEQPKVKVKLLKAHEHAGKKHPKDAEIYVTPQQAKWLSDNGIIAAAAAPKEA